jgi:signal transduction histidine kinase
MSGLLSKLIAKGFNQVQIFIWLLTILILGIHFAVYYAVVGLLWEGEQTEWLPELIISSVIILILASLLSLSVYLVGWRTRKATLAASSDELRALRAANHQVQSLQAMSSTLTATLSFERVMDVALDVCSVALEEMDIPARSFVGGVFLYDRDELVAVATRRFVQRDFGMNLTGSSGIVAKALANAEVAVTDKPNQDPELNSFVAFQNCRYAACLPLRAGFQIFGVMVLGTESQTRFGAEHLDLFGAIADQAVMALQNAQLYQKLEAEKQRIIDADEEARRELARDLHDGPTQSIAAIAMRVNFIRSLMPKDPRAAYNELKKVEALAKQTSREIRGMLFTLRPLVLEHKGLGAAIETVMEKMRETDGLNMRLIGAEFGDLLNEQAQGTVFYIVEEALGNARKHAGASLIEVRLWREGSLFVARISDDGKGFDTTAVNANYSTRGSLGMVNMRERIERIDGSMQIESAPNQGTTITLVVPIDKHGKKSRDAEQ